MAAAGEITNANEVLLIDPAKIVGVTENNSRTVSEADVKARCDSFERQGQDTPILVRPVNGKFEVVFGFTRHAAAVLYNQRHPTKKMKLKAIVREMTDEEAYTASIIENHERKNPDPVEIAKAQETLRTKYGKANAEIAALYGWKGRQSEQVGKLQKLLELPAPVKKLVSKRELPLIAALEMVGLTEEEQTEILATAERMQTGKIKGESVRAKVKAKKRDSGKSMIRSLKEVVEFFGSLTGPGEDKHVRKLAVTMEQYCKGEIEEPKAWHTFSALGGMVAVTGKYEPKETKAEEKARVKKEKTEQKAADKTAKADAKAAKIKADADKKAAKAAKAKASAKPKAKPAAAAADAPVAKKPPTKKPKAPADPEPSNEPEPEPVDTSVGEPEPEPVEI